MRVIDAQLTAQCLSMRALIAALRQRFAGGCTVPPRGVHQWPDAQGGQITSLVMPAWIEGEAYGVKVINMASGNGARGLPGLHAAYLLFDAQTGVPRALIDGDQLTLRRTAAASALAASFLARPDAQELLVVGAGRIAERLPWAYREVRPLRRVRVWARRPEQAQALVRRWVETGLTRSSSSPSNQGDGTEFGEAGPLDVQAVTDLGTAAARADIISCATLAHEPVVKGAWLRAGQHLDLIGSFTPQMREADDDCFRGARLFVDVREALVKSGELIGPMSRGVFTEHDVVADLRALCLGESAGRRAADERTVFKSVGTALEDLAAACLVWDACARGATASPPV